MEEPEPDRKRGCWNFIKVTSLAFALMGYELISFVGFLSLSIGVGTGVKRILQIFLNYQLPVTLETFCSWYTLAACTEIHLKLYRKCVFPSIKINLRQHPHTLQGFPRAIYFLLYCAAIFGLYYEYEAVHSYRPLKLHTTKYASGRHAYHLGGYGYNENQSDVHSPQQASQSYFSSSHHFHVYKQDDFAPEGPNEKIHTALFLMMMSYIIYTSGQILCAFLLRILRGIPYTPIFPQFYATFSMMVLQIIMTIFYAFPILMGLIACHMFHVDGVSTYLFTLCLAMCVSMAAAQLESESPFPVQPRMAPYFYYEGQFRARINIIFLILPLVAYYYFNPHRSYPLTAHDKNFNTYTFWLQVGIMHTIKALYLTTWRPMNPIEFPVVPPDQLERDNFQVGPIIPYPHYPNGDFQRQQEPAAAAALGNFQSFNNLDTSNIQPSRLSPSKNGNGGNDNPETDEANIFYELEIENQNNRANPHIFIANTTMVSDQQLGPLETETGSSQKRHVHNSKSLTNPNCIESTTPELAASPSTPESVQGSKSTTLFLTDNHNDLVNDNAVITTTSSGLSKHNDAEEIEKIFQGAQGQDQVHLNQQEQEIRHQEIRCDQQINETQMKKI